MRNSGIPMHAVAHGNPKAKLPLLTDLVMDNVGPAFCAIYRWRLHPGSEASFVQTWSKITGLLLNERGSLGSRLHRGPDDIWYSYTQ